MPEKPAITLSGDSPFVWSVRVYQTASGTFYALVSVGTWHAIGNDLPTADEAKKEGCSMMANMTAELEDLINA